MSSVRSISRHVPAVFAAVMVLFIGALAWSGWILIQQDSDLADQRKRDLVETAVSEAAATLAVRLAEEQQALRRFLSDDIVGLRDSTQGRVLGDGITLEVGDGMVRAVPDTSLRYLPFDPPVVSVDARLLEADRLEFGQRALERAATLLAGLSNADPITRGGALLRMARIRRKQGRNDDALGLYGRLADVPQTSLSGIPTTLLGRYGRCEILANQQENAALAEEAIELGRALLRGGHPISEATYLFYAKAVADWVAQSGTTSAPEWILALDRPHVPSEAAIRLHEIYEAWRTGKEASEGARSLRLDSALVLLQWFGSQDRFAGSIDEVGHIGGTWLQPLEADLGASGIGLSITDDSGNRLFARGIPTGNIQATRTIASAGQAWTLTSYVTASLVIESQDRGRKRMLLAALFFVIVIVATSTYFLSRAMRRELAISRLQSDFVSAVSHEFRTPLTSMRQITELLLSGRVPSDERKQAYYADLDKESRRLTRLVEGLLNFGRMEAGGFPYAFEAVAVGEMVRATLAEFRDEASVDADHVRLAPEANPTCRIDRETFKLALWNLLDNALKYSVGEPEILVTVGMRSPGDANGVRGATGRNAEAFVSVRDHGPGISPEDQAHVFEKFVRGSGSALAGVRGTGLGLALVKTILTDHGGRVLLQSEPGVGSTFSLILPIYEES